MRDEQNSAPTTDKPPQFEFFPFSADMILRLPFYACAVPAGFPSPADDHLRSSLDLNEHMVRHPAATFFTTCGGRSMEPLMFEGDLMVIDRAEKPEHGKVVLAILDGGMTCKRLYMKNGEIELVPENKDFSRIKITEGMDFEVWGVLLFVVRQVR